jgi:hypothetical protein
MWILDSINSGKRVETAAEEGPAGRQTWPSTVSGLLFRNKIMHANKYISDFLVKQYLFNLGKNIFSILFIYYLSWLSDYSSDII